jgi:hypothetical protein
VSGSSKSGQDIEAGRLNKAGGTTQIFWESAAGEEWNYGAVFVAGISESFDGPKPDGPLTGIQGLGWNETYKITSVQVGGTGVEGIGSVYEGSGVVGIAGGATFHQDFAGNQIVGSGGIGVLGEGGATPGFLPGGEKTTSVGPGVLGVGGRQPLDVNEEQASHAAGVVGFGGGSNPQEASYLGGLSRASERLTKIDMGGAGVWALGASTEIRLIGTKPSGPKNPGPGVVGIGGQQRGLSIFAAGVMGVSGLRHDPAVPVLDKLPFVAGHGSGVYGLSFNGRGGMFESEGQAAINLVPNVYRNNFGSKNSVAPTEYSDEGVGFNLPKEADPGDILSIRDSDRLCTYWVCVKGSGSGPAKWAQLLVGSEIEGNS